MLTVVRLCISAFADQIADSDSSKQMRGKFIELMRRRLVDDPELLDKMVPDFPPHCRRLTPGPGENDKKLMQMGREANRAHAAGYLEALTKENLEFIQTPIREFTEDGIITTDGVHRPVEAVICSTGANTHFAPPFPVVVGEYDISRVSQTLIGHEI